MAVGAMVSWVGILHLLISGKASQKRLGELGERGSWIASLGVLMSSICGGYTQVITFLWTRARLSSSIPSLALLIMKHSHGLARLSSAQMLYKKYHF
jgi:hypothetical protein